MAAASKTSPSHAADAPEFDQKVIDKGGHSMAGTPVAATNEPSSSSAWARSDHTALNPDTFALAATVVNSDDNIFSAAARRMPEAP